MQTAPSAPESALLFHREHQQRLEKFAAAAAVHVEKIRCEKISAINAWIEKITAEREAERIAREERIAQKRALAAAMEYVEHPISKIQRAVAKAFDVSIVDMLSARRTVNVALPRQVAIYLAKTLTLKSLPEIGRRFGGRDHTTILHSVRKIESLIARDPAMAEMIAALKASLALSQ